MSKAKKLELPDNPVDVLEEELKADGIPIIVDLHEVARVARRSYSSVWRESASDKLVSFKHGRKKLVRRRDLAAWLLGAV